MHLRLLAPLLALLPVLSPAGAPARASTPVPVVSEDAAVSLRDADGSVLFHLGPDLVRRLRRAGAPLDGATVAAARRLARRDFGAEAFVAAVERAARQGDRSARCIEGAAVWAVLDLPWRHLRDYCDSGQPLSSYLDGYRRRSRRMELTGYALSGVGAAALVAGTVIAGVVIHVAVKDASRSEEHDSSGVGFLIQQLLPPIAGLGAGGAALLAAGLPLAVIGRHRRKALDRSDATVDQGSAGALQAHVRRRDLEALAGDGPTLSLGGGPARSTGLSLQLRF